MEKIVNVSLRLTEQLHEAIMELATREHRSMHAQIVHLIEQATGAPDTVRRRRIRRPAAPPQEAEG